MNSATQFEILIWLMLLPHALTLGLVAVWGLMRLHSRRRPAWILLIVVGVWGFQLFGLRTASSTMSQLGGIFGTSLFDTLWPVWIVGNCALSVLAWGAVGFEVIRRDRLAPGEE